MKNNHSLFNFDDNDSIVNSFVSTNYVSPTAPTSFSSPVTTGATPTLTSVTTGTVGGTQVQMDVFAPGTVTADINPAMLYQGQIGDCFLIASIGELALRDPTRIAAMITENANGTQNVKLYESANGSLPTFGTSLYKSVSETVTDAFPSYSVNNGATQDVINGVKMTWPQVLEEAIANLDGGYSAISNGGSPLIAMEELTGNTASWFNPASVNQSMLQSMISARDMIVLDTSASNSTYNLVGNHAYMFEGLVTQGGTTYVQAGNPWGFNQPSLIPVSALSKAFVEVDVCKS